MGAGAAVVLVGAGTFAVLSEPDQAVTAGPGATTSTSIEPVGGPPTTGGPVLSADEGRAATELVGSFLRGLREEDYTSALALWSGYPDAVGGQPGEDDAEKLRAVVELGSSRPWLVGDPTPSLVAVAGPSFGPAVPVITVTVDGPDGPKAEAFVLGGSADAGTLIIERLPDIVEEPSVAVGPGAGTATITFKLLPVEGGPGPTSTASRCCRRRSTTTGNASSSRCRWSGWRARSSPWWWLRPRSRPPPPSCSNARRAEGAPADERRPAPRRPTGRPENSKVPLSLGVRCHPSGVLCEHTFDPNGFG